MKRPGRREGRAQCGYTLTELVLVIVIIGIMAALAGPRFFSADVFKARGFNDEALAAVRYAQKLAMASGCDIRVDFDGAGFSLGRWATADCQASAAGTIDPVLQPGGGDFSDRAPSGVALGSAVFYFDGIGRPRVAATGGSFGQPLSSAIDITIGTRTLRVEPETGFTFQP